MFLESMTMLLKTMEGVELVVTATNGREVLRFLELHDIDVVICDFQMPLINGVEVIVSARKNFPAARVLILSMSDDLSNIKSAIQAGAAGLSCLLSKLKGGVSRLCPRAPVRTAKQIPNTRQTFISLFRFIVKGKIAQRIFQAIPLNITGFSDAKSQSQGIFSSINSDELCADQTKLN